MTIAQGIQNELSSNKRIIVQPVPGSCIRLLLLDVVAGFGGGEGAFRAGFAAAFLAGGGGDGAFFFAGGGAAALRF